MVGNTGAGNSLSTCRAWAGDLVKPSVVSREESTMKLPVKTIGATLVAASIALAGPAEARWRGGGWGGLGFCLAAGALLGGAIAASAYPYGYGYGYRSYGYGYGYRSYGYGYPPYGYGYPAYRVAYASYPSWGYGYYPRRAYGYAYAPRLRSYAYYPRRSYAYYPRRAYGAYAF